MPNLTPDENAALTNLTTAFTLLAAEQRAHNESRGARPLRHLLAASCALTAALCRATELQEKRGEQFARDLAETSKHGHH